MLHAFEKKGQKMPKRDSELARARLAIVLARRKALPHAEEEKR